MQSVKLPDLPIPTCDASAVMINDRIYVCGGFCGGVDLARQVQEYDVNRCMWRKISCSPQYNSQGVAINNNLVLIGGCEAESHRVTNLVSTWTGQGWQQDLPPMPTKRIEHSATTYHTFVVVAGGRAEDKQTLLSSIDILNITTRQWWTPVNFKLPQPMYDLQCTISSAHLCVASACINYDAATRIDTTNRDVWQLPVTALESILITNGDNSTPHQWTSTAPTPYYKSSMLQNTAQIVAVGGDDSLDEPTSDIFVYNPNRDEWSKVGQLGVPRTRCAVVSLSRTSFIVCGGCTDSRDTQNTLLSSVEVVHV